MSFPLFNTVYWEIFATSDVNSVTAVYINACIRVYELFSILNMNFSHSPARSIVVGKHVKLAWAAPGYGDCDDLNARGKTNTDERPSMTPTKSLDSLLKPSSDTSLSNEISTGVLSRGYNSVSVSSISPECVDNSSNPLQAAVHLSSNGCLTAFTENLFSLVAFGVACVVCRREKLVRLPEHVAESKWSKCAIRREGLTNGPSPIRSSCAQFTVSVSSNGKPLSDKEVASIFPSLLLKDENLSVITLTYEKVPYGLWRKDDVQTHREALVANSLGFCVGQRKRRVSGMDAACEIVWNEIREIQNKRACNPLLYVILMEGGGI